jgi:hypothetical protein
MATRTMNSGVVSWSSKMPFPKDRYQIACIEEKFAPSKNSGNPMITRVFEIVSPEQIEVGDMKVAVGGLKFTQYVTIKVKDEDGEGWNAEKSDKAFGRFAEELKVVGFEEESIDDENPPLFFLKKNFDAIVYAKCDVARKSPTPEQARKGQPGDVIKDAFDKEVKTYQLALDQILGVAVTEVGVQY